MDLNLSETPCSGLVINLTYPGLHDPHSNMVVLQVLFSVSDLTETVRIQCVHLSQ